VWWIMAFRAAGARSFSDAYIFPEALVMEQPASSDSSAAACLSDFWVQLMGFRVPATVLPLCCHAVCATSPSGHVNLC
jgi:hypothetical protein